MEKVEKGYKKTKVGIIPDDWKVVKLGEVCDILDNKRVPINSEKRAKISGDIPYYGANGVVDYINDFIFDEKLVLLAEDGGNFSEHQTKPIAYIIEGKSWVNNHTHILRAKNGENNFLFYSLVHKNIMGFINVGTRLKLNRRDLINIPLHFPPLKEQQKIAEILTTWDNAIETQEKLIETKERLKKGLMQKLLSGEVRFDGYFDEWEVVKLGEVGKIKKGEQLNRLNFVHNGEYPVINGGINLSGYTTNYNRNENTITISEGGNSCGYVNFITTKFWSGGHCYSLSDLDINLYFLYQYLKLNELSIMRLRVGSGLPNIQKGDIENFKLKLPSLPEQQKIAEVLSTADKEIELLKNKLEELKNQKKGLMQKLLTGQIRVKI